VCVRVGVWVSVCGREEEEEEEGDVAWVKHTTALSRSKSVRVSACVCECVCE